VIPTCQEITELVTEYLLDELPVGERMRFSLHIALCRHCRRYLRQMRATIKVTGKLPQEPIPEAVMSELMKRFEGWKR
jgi:anti-sigma factor RsiW